MHVVGVLGKGLVDPDTPVVPADDLGLTRGDGCFEGCRVLDGAVYDIEAHVARMRRSASALEIAFDEPAWRALVDEAVAAWPARGEAGMRWFLTRGRPGGPPAGIVTIGPVSEGYVTQRRDGIRAISLNRGIRADAFTDVPWLLGGVKTMSYAVNMAAGREAARRGADDLIFVSGDGVVLEGPTSAVVWTVGDAMYTTPHGDTGVLASTSQQRLFSRAAENGWRTELATIRLDDLHAADAVFLTGAVRGPVDVVDLDGHARGRDVDLVRTVQKLAGF